MSIPLVKAVPLTVDGVATGARRWAAYLVLGAALAVGLALRLYGLNWDQAYGFHPDERAIFMYVQGKISLPMPIDFGQLLDPKTSPLNPHWFPYGSLPLYLLKLVAHVLSLVKQSYAGDELRLVGRSISAVFDTGTILLVFLIGRRIYSRRVAALAALFVSLAVIDIQLSHFFAVDAMLVFFILLTIYACVNLAEHGRDRDVVLVGVGVGLSLATKVSTAPILVPVGVAFLLNALNEKNRKPGEDLQARLNSSIKRLLVCLLVAGVVFVITEPYAILDRDTFWASVTEQSEMVRRIRDYPYTRQYIDTPAYTYDIVQLGKWGLGPALGVVAWGGLAFAAAVAVVRRRRGDILLLSWVLPYFAITGAFEVKFMRYLLPLAPIICLMGARMLFSLRDGARNLGSRGPMAANAVIGLVVVATAFYALSYMNIYSMPHTAVRMSQWINANVPKGAMILKEHWEEGIPNLGAYRGGDLNLYENDDANKLNHIVNQVRNGDYIVFFSNRLYGTIPRLPERYPVTSRYYQLLFGGKLGYELVNYETAYPGLLGVTFVDDTFGRPKLPIPPALAEFKPSPITIDGGFADESFSVYDHPKVMLFKKVKTLSDQELRAMFADIAINRPPPDQSTKPGLLLSPTEAKANQEGGTWSELFARGGLTNRLPVLSWLVLVEIIALATLPIGALLFRRLADRGYMLTKALGILLVTYLSWLFSATRVLPFSQPTILLSLAMIALFSAYLAYRFRNDLLPFVKTRWRLLVVIEAVFLIAFFAFYLIRLANPDLWHAWRGGEKPMEFAYLNAVVKTTYFPPYDPWLAGGYMNYYYYGQVVVATLIKAVGIVPAVAYNLAVPLLFALTFGGAFSIGYNLWAARNLARSGDGDGDGGPHHNPLRAQRAPGRAREQNTPWRERGQDAERGEKEYGAGVSWSGLACGLLAAMMVTVLSNMDGILQIVNGLSKAGALNFQSTIPGLAGAVNAVVGTWRVVIDHRALPAFDFWRSSRMMPGTNNITEFPYFTFLFADLHAHLIALPFTILAIGTALNVALSGRRGNGGADAPPLVVPKYVERLPWPLAWPLSSLISAFPLPRLLPVVALALVVGALRIINSWDFPTYLALAIAAILIGEIARRERIGLSTIFWFAVKAALVFWLSSFLYRPFHDKYELFASGIDLGKEKTLIEHYLAIHLLFLFAIISYLLLEIRRHFGRSGFLRTNLLALRYWENLPHILALRKRLVKKTDPGASLVGYAVLVVLLVAAALVWLNLTVIAFLSVILTLVAPPLVAELRKRQATMGVNLFVLTMIGLAVGIGIGVDLIALKVAGEVGRMNTVFKFYLQAWVLFSVAGGYGLVAVLSELGRRHGKVKSAGIGRLWSIAIAYATLPRWKAAWGAALVVLLAIAVIYPIAATRVRVQDRFAILPPTDDGMAYMKTAVYSDENRKVELGYDYDAITWMQDNIKGSPPIVEAFTPLYRWGSRVSIYTGLPTIIGWDWHQSQQRWAYRWMIEARQKDVRAIYTNPDPKTTLDLLKKYGVKYVYLGELERLYFGGPSLAKFDQMVGKDLELAYSNKAVKIYEVR